jgi:anti-sigma regulatory factor (Ser/Thr protein kinase)
MAASVAMDRFRTIVDERIPRAPECAARARELVRARLDGHAADERVDTALLVTSELVTNAWKHGEGAIRLRMDVRDGRVRIEVIDQGSGATVGIRPQAGDASGGWGLQLVHDVAADWGSFEGTTHVWAEVDIGVAE